MGSIHTEWPPPLVRSAWASFPRRTSSSSRSRPALPAWPWRLDQLRQFGAIPAGNASLRLTRSDSIAYLRLLHPHGGLCLRPYGSKSMRTTSLCPCLWACMAAALGVRICPACDGCVNLGSMKTTPFPCLCAYPCLCDGFSRMGGHWGRPALRLLGTIPVPHASPVGVASLCASSSPSPSRWQSRSLRAERGAITIRHKIRIRWSSRLQPAKAAASSNWFQT